MYLHLILPSLLLASDPTEIETKTLEEPAAPPALVQDEAVAEDPHWKGAFDLGFSFTDGNSSTLTLNAGLDANRETERDVWKFRAWWNVQQDEGKTSENDVGASLDYNYKVTDRFYWVGTSGAGHDAASNLNLRWWAGAGAGYSFLNDEPTLFSGDLAVTYFDEEFGDGSGDGYIAARGAYDFAHQVSETTRFSQVAEIFPSLEEADDVYARVDTKLRMDISATFFGQIQYVYDWDNTPAAGNKREDHKLIVGIGWTFGG